MPSPITQSADGTLQVPDEPIIPFIEGDGTGVDIWPAAQHVFDAAAAKHGKRIEWKEVLAGQKAYDQTGNWLPDETVDAFRSHLIGIKGPLTTPIGGGIRSLNVALRQILDLYVCLRPVRCFTGGPFLTGTINAAIVLLVLDRWTFADYAFPLYIFLIASTLTATIVSRQRSLDRSASNTTTGTALA